MSGWSTVRDIRGILLAGLQWTRPTTALLALLFAGPLAATAQGSMCSTRTSAIQALSTGTIAEVANLVTIVIRGYVFSHLSPLLVELANKSYSTATTLANYALLTADIPPPIALQLWGHSVANVQMTTLSWRVRAVMHPVIRSVIISGPLRRPTTQRRCKLLASSPRKLTIVTIGTWEPALAQLRRVRPEQQRGEFNKRRDFHVPEQNTPQPRSD